MKAKKRRAYLDARLKDYSDIIGRLGWNGVGELPKRWQGFNRPGSTKK